MNIGINDSEMMMCGVAVLGVKKNNYVWIIEQMVLSGMAVV